MTDFLNGDLPYGTLACYRRWWLVPVACGSTWTIPSLYRPTF